MTNSSLVGFIKLPNITKVIWSVPVSRLIVSTVPSIMTFSPLNKILKLYHYHQPANAKEPIIMLNLVCNYDFLPLAGLGVIATRKICANQYVCHYTGVYVDPESILDETYCYEIKYGPKKFM